VIRSSIAPTGSSWLRKLALALRALYLERPGLITKVLAVVAFFSIGVV
jgi:hypothetical protein